MSTPPLLSVKDSKMRSRRRRRICGDDVGGRTMNLLGLSLLVHPGGLKKVHLVIHYSRAAVSPTGSVREAEEVEAAGPVRVEEVPPEAVSLTGRKEGNLSKEDLRKEVTVRVVK